MHLNLSMLLPSVMVSAAAAAFYFHRNREMFAARYGRLKEELEAEAKKRDVIFSSPGAPKNAEFKLKKLGFNIAYKHFLFVNGLIGLLLAALCAALLKNPKLALLSAAIWMVFAHKILDMTYEGKVKQPVAEQAELALQLLAESYEVTKDLLEAFKQVAGVMEPPLKEEFEILIADNNLGKDINACMIEFAERIDNRDMETFVRGIVLSSHYGTDTYEVLNETSEIIRERRELKEELISETKGKNFTITIFLLAIPLALVYLMATSEPARNMFINSSKGHNLLCLTLLVEFVSWYFSRQKGVSERF